MSKEQKERKARKPGTNQVGNEQVLQDIRVTLAAHQSSRKSVTPSPVTVRDTATPSPVPDSMTSPGSLRSKSRPSPVDFDRHRHHYEQMAKIRDNLKPHHRSDPGFNLPSDQVNQEMLQELIMRGYDQNSCVAALQYCNSHSIEAALDFLTSPRKPLSSIREASITSGGGSGPKPYPSHHENEQDRYLPAGTVNIDDIIPDDSYFDTTPAASLPGHLKSSKQSAVIMEPYPPTLVTRDLSPIHSSPDQSPHGTPPPESKHHVHVSPPPDVQPRTYSPFSAPFSRQMHTPPVYDRNARLPHGYSPIVRPSSELSDSGIEEETVPQRNPVPPEAFKFYMEQHIENVLKAYQQRQQRRVKLEVEMGKRGLDEATCEQMRKLLAQKESNFLRMKRAKMHRDQFDIVKPIGVGAFGVVSLVRKKDTRRLYAMKSLRKADVVRRNQVAHVKAERDILAEADNEWVVKLYYSFQDAECLYFVMEYIPGGDMMSLLIKLGTFPEHLTLFYIAELVCAIESVHKMGFIHRDIKPDNILIEADGHIKLTDFGLCTGFRWTHDSKRYQPKGGGTGHSRQASIEPDTSAWNDQCTCPMKPLEIRRLKAHHRCVAHSLVGTPNYIAPEILRRVGYTQLCDWWSVGVIMYEMLVGQPPFMAPTPSETQLKIMNWPEYLRIPHHAQLSTAARDLIVRFLSDPQERIGRNGADEIKHHPFFTSHIDWDVGIRNYVAPYKPKIMYEGDTSNFDPVPQSQVQKMYKQQATPVMPKDHPEHAFYEFTFIRFAASDRATDSKKPTIAPSSSHGSGYSSSRETGYSSSHGSGSSSPSNHYDKPSTASTATAASVSSQRDYSKESRKEKKRTTPQPVYV